MLFIADFAVSLLLALDAAALAGMTAFLVLSVFPVTFALLVLLLFLALLEIIRLG